MAEWQRPIRCYLSPAGNNKIAEWYEALSAQERSDADAFILNMRKIRAWVMPHYRNLKGLGIGELRWKSDGKQQRLIGFFAGEFWYAVIGCTHKQGIYKPPEALETAQKRKTQIDKSEVDTVEYDL